MSESARPESGIGSNRPSRRTEAGRRSETGNGLRPGSGNGKAPTPGPSEDSPFRNLALDDALQIAAGIIPRLSSAEAARDRPTLDTGDPRNDHPDVVALARELLDAAFDARRSDVSARLRALVSPSRPVDDLLLGRLTETARHLGRCWEYDLIDFHQVTVAMGRLQRLMHDVAADGPLSPEQLRNRAPRHILLSAVPGEQHTFGVGIVAELFREHGWIVAGAPPSQDVEGCLRKLSALASERDYDVVGLSVSSGRNRDTVARAVRAVRNASPDPGVAILLGGPLAEDEPDLAQRSGADAVCRSAEEALRIAELYLRRPGSAPAAE